MTLAEKLRDITGQAFNEELALATQYDAIWYGKIRTKCHKAAKKTLSSCRIVIAPKWYQKKLSVKALQHVAQNLYRYLKVDGLEVNFYVYEYIDGDYKAYFNIDWSGKPKGGPELSDG